MRGVFALVSTLTLSTAAWLAATSASATPTPAALVTREVARARSQGHAEPDRPRRARLPLVQLGEHKLIPSALDGHVHTRHSPDAYEPTRDVLTLAQRAGLDVLVLTDHGVGHAARDLTDYEGPLLVMLGEEVGGAFGHAVLWNIDRRRGIADNLDSLSTLGAHVHEQGGLLVLAHPTWWMKHHEDAMHWMSTDALKRGGFSGEIDAFEIWNSIYVERQDQLVEAWLSALEAGVFVPAVGGSDFHRRTSHRLGRPRTVALSEQRSREDVLAALRKGRAYVTEEAGIALTIDARATFGDVLEVRPGQKLELAFTVEAPHDGGTLVIHRGRGVIHEQKLEPERVLTQTIELEVGDADSYVWAEIVRRSPRASRPRFSLITNPIRLEVAPLRQSWR